MPSLFRMRVLLAGLAVLGCVALGVLSRHRSQSPVVGAFSPAALAAVVLTAAAVLLLAGLAVAPSRHLSRCLAALRGRLHWIGSREPTMPPLAAAAVVLLAVASYAALTARFYMLNRVPAGDEREYLILAKQIRQSSLSDLLGGNYREANRHPLYPVILAWTGANEIDPTAFGRGKVTSVALAWLSFALLITLVARRFSLAVAAITAALLATNLALLRFTTLVACEGVLVLFSGLLWLSAAAVPPENARETQKVPDHESALLRGVDAASHGLALGAWAGLAYLTKGSALLLLFGLIVWIMVRRKTRLPVTGEGWAGVLSTSPLVGESRGGSASPRQETPAWSPSLRSLALVLVSFLLVASPLLLRNTRVYGNPFHNSNTPFLFSDNFEEALRRSDPSRPADENESTWAAARRYFRTHSIGQVLDRAASGVATELFIFLRALGPAPFQESRALVGAPILVLALVGMAVRPRRDAMLVLIWIGLFIPFFGWYVPIAAGDRFVLPLIVPIYVYAACALACLAGGSGNRRAAGALVLAAAAWSALCVGATLVRTIGI